MLIKFFDAYKVFLTPIPFGVRHQKKLYKQPYPGNKVDIAITINNKLRVRDIGILV